MPSPKFPAQDIFQPPDLSLVICRISSCIIVNYSHCFLCAFGRSRCRLQFQRRCARLAGKSDLRPDPRGHSCPPRNRNRLLLPRHRDQLPPPSHRKLSPGPQRLGLCREHHLLLLPNQRRPSKQPPVPRLLPLEPQALTRQYRKYPANRCQMCHRRRETTPRAHP